VSLDGFLGPHRSQLTARGRRGHLLRRAPVTWQKTPVNGQKAPVDRQKAPVNGQKAPLNGCGRHH